MIGIFILLLIQILGVQIWLLYVLCFSLSITVVGLRRLILIYKWHCVMTFFTCISCLIYICPCRQGENGRILRPIFAFVQTLNRLLSTFFGLYKIKSFAIMQPDTSYVGCIFPSIKFFLSLLACMSVVRVLFVAVKDPQNGTRLARLTQTVNFILYTILYIATNSLIMHVVRSFKKYSNTADNVLKFQIKSSLFVVPLLFYTSFLVFTFAVVLKAAKLWDLLAFAALFDVWINNMIMNIHIYGFQTFQLMKTMFAGGEDFDTREVTRMIELPGLHPLRITRDQIHRNPVLQGYAMSDENHIGHRRPEYDDHSRRSRYPELDVDRSFDSDDLSREDKFYE